MNIFFNLLFLIIPIFLILGFGYFLYFYKQREAKNAVKLLKFFNGKFPMPFGSVTFEYCGAIFRIARIAAGGGIYGVSGSFPDLWAYTEKFQKIIIGNPKSKNFTKGNFLILPPHRIVNINGNDLLIGAESEELIEMIGTKIHEDSVLSKDIFELFQEDFSHITFSTELHVGGKTLINKQSVFHYIGSPETIYESPELLESRLKIIMKLAKDLGIRFKK